MCEFITDPQNVDYGHVAREIITGGLMFKVGSNPDWLNSVFVRFTFMLFFCRN